ncbi:MAG: AsmA family protein, partial [Hallerella sp.]|nr:AsmA family protein [Hallerella sp.]
MKKALRIIGIVVAVLLLLVIVACFAAPKIAKGYIEEHSKELVGRQMQIGDISFNPFRFTFSIENFSLFEPDDSTRFVAFKQFYVNADPACLFIGDICLSEVKIDSPYARVVKNGKVFNFTDILEHFEAKDDSVLNGQETVLESKEDSVQVNVADSVMTQVNAL